MSSLNCADRQSPGPSLTPTLDPVPVSQFFMGLIISEQNSRWSNYRPLYLVWWPFVICIWARDNSQFNLSAVFFAHDVLRSFNVFLFENEALASQHLRPEGSLFWVSFLVRKTTNVTHAATYEEWFWSPVFIWCLDYYNAASTSWNQSFRTSQATILHVCHVHSDKLPYLRQIKFKARPV